jgi:hypothetical protein
LGRFDALLGAPVGVHSLAAARIGVGVVAAIHLWPLALDVLRGGEHGFVHPYVSWYPDLAPGPFTAVLLGGAIAAIAMTVGVATRVAVWLTFGVVAYHTLLSTTHVHNNRAYLFAVLLVLAMAPTGRVWSVDAWWLRRRGRPVPRSTTPGWPLWLLRFECALVYGASGFSKLIDPDWFGGTVTYWRVANEEALVRASVLPGLVQDLLLDRSVHTVVAKVIVLTELFIAAGLWWRRTRPVAVATAVVFHVAIGLSADVQVFSYLGIAVLVVWADPGLTRVRERLARSRHDDVRDLPGTAPAATRAAGVGRRRSWSPSPPAAPGHR